MDNFYITALELGERHMDKGISYIQARDFFGLKENTYKELAFRNWFYSNFYNDDMPPHYVMNNGVNGLTEPTNHKPSYLTGDAHMKLIEYRELQEARSSALKAQNDTKTATILAVSSLVLAAVVSIIEIYIEYKR